MRLGNLILTIFLFISAFSMSALAANIAVDVGEVEIDDNNRCSLREAIINANDDAQTHDDCDAGNGLDTIILPNNSTFTLFDAPGAFDLVGNNGLPPIRSLITINGNGSTIERDSSLSCNLDEINDPGEFRIFVVNDANLILNNLIIQNGCADDNDNGGDGGTISVSGLGSSLSLNNSTIRNSRSVDKSGAVATEDTLLNVNFFNSTFSNNFAGVGGGVIAVGNGNVVSIIGSTFEGNVANGVNIANQAGGGAIGVASSGNVGILNSTFTGNSTPAAGGAIGNLGTVVISNSTIANNIASDSLLGFGIPGGGGIGNSGNLTIKNSIVANNGVGEDCATLGGTFDAEGDNFDTDGTCEALDGDFTQVSTAELNLGSLADNGGPTETIPLLPGSVAIDGVTDCEDLISAALLTLDQRGRSRAFPAGGSCDVGAFEFGYELLDNEFRTSRGFSIPLWCGERKDEFTMDGVDFVNVEQYDTQIEIVLPQKRILGLLPTNPTIANIIETLTITEPSNFQSPGSMTLPVRTELRSGKTLKFDCEDILALPTRLDNGGDIDQLLDELLMDVDLFHGVLNIETANRDLRVFVTKLVRSSKGIDQGSGLDFVESQLDKDRSEIESFSLSNTQSEIFGLGLTTLNVIQKELGDRAIEFRAQILNTQEMSIEIYGLNGQRVYSATSPSNSLVWRMQDHSGRSVANGVYLYAIRALDGQGNVVRSDVKKLVVMR